MYQVEAFAQALEDPRVVGEPVADIAAAKMDGEAIKATIVGDEGEGGLVVITVEPGATEAKAQPENDVPA